MIEKLIEKLNGKEIFSKIREIYILKNIIPIFVNCIGVSILVFMLLTIYLGDFYIYQDLKNNDIYYEEKTCIVYEEGMIPIQLYKYKSDYLYIQTNSITEFKKSELKYIKAYYENKSTDGNMVYVDTKLDLSGSEIFKDAKPYKIYKETFIEKLCEYDNIDNLFVKVFKTVPSIVKYYTREDIISIVISAIIGVLLIDVLFKFFIWFLGIIINVYKKLIKRMLIK